MTRRVSLSGIRTPEFELESRLLTTEEVIQILQEWLAMCRAMRWVTGTQEVALEHVVADHEGRSPMVDWPATHRLVDQTLQDALRLTQVKTTWPGE